MKKIILLTLSLLLATTITAVEPTKGFFKFEAKALTGENIKMEDYAGKYVLVVNTASKCGFTPQFEGLEDMYAKYKDKGLVILGFPCNQFGGQEPGDELSIAEGCVQNYGVTFPMFSKIEVNGENEHPIYSFLKSQKEGDIKWNFTKFLVNPQGEVISRYESRDTPQKIENDIKTLL